MLTNSTARGLCWTGYRPSEEGQGVGVQIHEKKQNMSKFLHLVGVSRNLAEEHSSPPPTLKINLPTFLCRTRYFHSHTHTLHLQVNASNHHKKDIHGN